MRVVLTYGKGTTVDGVLLAGSPEHMRVAVAGKSDTVELVRVDGIWRAENGERVDIDAVMAIDGVDCAELIASLAPRTMGVGGAGS